MNSKGMNYMKLSICMMVKDEEKNLERCLESLRTLLKYSDIELIVIDTGSQDKTVEIAKRYTEKIFFHQWNNDFSDMRNKTISYAKGEWILIIDADEEVVNADEIFELIYLKETQNYNTIIFQVNSFNNIDNKNIGAINPSPRLFKNDGHFKYVGAVHNQPVYKKPIKVTDILINHYGYILDDKELMEKKFNRTKDILESELLKNPNNIYYQFQLGVAYDMHGDARKAYIEFEKAYNMIINLSTREKKERIYIYSAFARSASLNKMYQMVIKICEEGIKLRNDFVDLYYILAVAYRVTGMYIKSNTNLKKYLELIRNFKNLEIAKDLTVSFYNIDLASIDSAYFNMIYNYFDLGEKHKAKEHIVKLKNIDKKIYWYINLIDYIKSDNELLDFYNSIDSKGKMKFIEALEEKINCNNEIDIRKVFSMNEDLYAQYNKILINERKGIDVKKDIIELLSLIDLNNSPKYIRGLLFYIIKTKVNIYEIFKNTSTENLEMLLEYCCYKYSEMIDNMKLFIKVNEFFDEKNINHLRINKVLLKTILLDCKTNEIDKEILYKYIDIGIKYIDKVYQKQIIEEEMIFLLKEEDAFILLLSKAEEIKSVDSKTYIKYLKRAINICPKFKDYIDVLKTELEEKYNENNNQINNELENYKVQVKSNIKFLIENDNLEEAIMLLKEYEKIASDDIETVLLKSIIAIKKI